MIKSDTTINYSFRSYLIFVSLLSFLLFFSCDLFNSSNSSNNDTWILSIGGEGRDYAPSFCATSGGFVVVGMTSSYGLGNGGNNLTGLHDFLAVKLDGSGNHIWSTTIGGADDERGSYSAQNTNDGGFLLTGSTRSFGSGSMDMFVVKINSDGSHDWTKAIGGVGAEVGKTTLELSDGYIIAGETNSVGAGQSDILIVKMNFDGSLAWTKTYGGIQNDSGSGIAEVSGGFIIGATLESFGAGTADAALLKINTQGDVIWAKTIGGAVGEGINWDGVRITDTGDIIFGDATSSFGAQGGGAYFGIRLSSEGILDWCTFVDGPQLDAGWTMNQADDGFIGGGKYSIPGNGGDILLVKFEENGAFSWAHTIGGSGLDEIEEIKQIDDSYYFAGVTRMTEPNGDFIFAKINLDGYTDLDPELIEPVNSPTVKPLNPQITNFIPIVTPAQSQINILDVLPTITHPNINLQFIE